MTEFDLALEFLQTFVDASAGAAERGESVDDRQAFRRHCGGLGLKPTPQRMELVRDLAGVIKECLGRVEAAGNHADDDERHFIPAVSLADGLEQHGWRLGFLTQQVAT